MTTRTRAYICNAETVGRMRTHRCTRDEHADPFHKDDDFNVSWCADCSCRAGDHMTASQMESEDPVIRKDGLLSACCDCAECPAVLPEGWA